MIASIMAFVCIAVMIYFSSCLIVDWIFNTDEDGAVMKVSIVLSVVYLLGLLSGWWAV